MFILFIDHSLAGLLKKKSQDICILPNNVNKTLEVLVDGLLVGETDVYGKTLTERVLSVNVRSQLSSLGNNFDTLYERTFAEAMNLHLRCSQMVLGEVYMIPVYEYDKHEAQKNRCVWLTRQTDLERYIKAFEAINNRIPTISNPDIYKYERVCLLIVDFSQPIPKIYSTDADLVADGLLPITSTASITNLSFPSFVQYILNIYSTRFGTGRFI